MHDGHRFIFTGGSHRSGTTLVQNMLDSHPAIFGGPEFLHIPEIIGLRNSLQRSVSRRYIDQFCSPDEVNAQIRALIECLLLPLTERHGAQLISEKTPPNVLVFCELGELWPKARFIHVVRDPRAIVASMLAVGARAARRGHRVQAFTRDIDGAIRHIRECFDAGFEATRREPDRVFTVVYEKLVREPEQETRKLCAFLGIDWCADMTTPAGRKHPGERAITMESKEVWYDAQTYYSNPNTNSLDRWRKKLTPLQQRQGLQGLPGQRGTVAFGLRSLARQSEPQDPVVGRRGWHAERRAQTACPDRRARTKAGWHGGGADRLHLRSYSHFASLGESRSPDSSQRVAILS